jgi:hypothetical protein
VNKPEFKEIKNAGNVKLRNFTSVEIDVPTNWTSTTRQYAWNLLEKELERLEMRVTYV